MSDSSARIIDGKAFAAGLRTDILVAATELVRSGKLRSPAPDLI